MLYMLHFKHTLYHAVVIRGQDEGQNHDQFLQGVFFLIEKKSYNSITTHRISLMNPIQITINDSTNNYDPSISW